MGRKRLLWRIAAGTAALLAASSANGQMGDSFQAPKLKLNPGIAKIDTNIVKTTLFGFGRTIRTQPAYGYNSVSRSSVYGSSAPTFYSGSAPKSSWFWPKQNPSRVLSRSYAGSTNPYYYYPSGAPSGYSPGVSNGSSLGTASSQPAWNAYTGFSNGSAPSSSNFPWPSATGDSSSVANSYTGSNMGGTSPYSSTGGTSPGFGSAGTGGFGSEPGGGAVAGPSGVGPSGGGGAGVGPGSGGAGGTGGGGSGMASTANSTAATSGQASPGGGEGGIIGDASPILMRRPVSASAVAGLPGPIPPGPLPNPPAPQDPSRSVRSFKISENQSPLPQDRFFYSFNFYDNVGRAVNRHFEAPLKDLQAFRHTFGFEKTFNQGMGSFGFRLPLDTLSANARTKQIATVAEFPTTTAIGDLNVFVKHTFYNNPDLGLYFSGGVSITAPTGPQNFANSPYLDSIHTTTIQPFLGYRFTNDLWYAQGFTSIETPVNPDDAMLFFSDVSFGYRLYQSDVETDFITAITPVFEVHANIPLNHRDAFNPRDASGTADIINLTYGTHFQLWKRAILTFGLVTPVSGPKPFDFETILLLNVPFGQSAQTGNFAPTVVGN